jgi:class 3 adenylate cyclase
MCGQEIPGSARFCPSCGTPLAAVEPSRPEVRKFVTVLFCDIMGSTDLGEQLDSESVRRLIGGYFTRMAEILERHGGTVEKFIGDAIVAVFGIPAVREDDALRAVRAAVEMRSALAEYNEQFVSRWGVRLQVRTGVNTGEVVAGDHVRGHDFVTGDAINTAARLEQAAAPGEILIGDATRRVVRDRVRVEPVAPLAVRGKAQPVAAFRLLEAASAPPVLRPLDAPLVGREREIAVLNAMLDHAVADRGCTLVTILGAAGVGKSRLCAEFIASLGNRGRAVIGRCLSYGDGIAFWPVREVMEALAGLGEQDSAETVARKLTALLPAGDDREVIVQRMAGLLGIGDSAGDSTEIFWAFRRLLEAVAAEQPTVVVFDDVQWGEPTFLDVLEYLVMSGQDAPIMLVAIARPELAEQRPQLPGLAHAAIELDPLDAAETRQLAEHLVGGTVLEAAARLLEPAEGNPLFVEELLRLRIDEGHLRLQGDRWTATEGLAGLSTPPTIQAIIAARLDRLPPPLRAVLERASVVGKVFWPAAVAELSPPAEAPELAEHLTALVRRQLLVAGGSALAGEQGLEFSHILVRDVAYGEILKARRADLHARCAGWIERVTADRASEYGELLGYHLERAYRYLGEVDPTDERMSTIAASASRHLGAAGGRALARGDTPGAVSLLERALSLLDEDAPSRRELALKLSIALAGEGQLSRVGALLSEHIDATRNAGTCVLHQEPGGRQQTYVLKDETPAVTIGRLPECDIALAWDTRVSRHHAELERGGGDAWDLVDSTSRNGTFLNGERVVGRRRIRNGDVIRVGDTVLLFRAPVAAAASAAPAPGVSTFAGSSLWGIELSETERRVLGVLRGSPHQPPAASTVRSNREIAQRASLSEQEVKAAVSAMRLKFRIDGDSQEWRERLVVRAISSGLISEPAPRNPE